METWDAIRARRNVRHYDGRPLPQEHLDRVLEAGWRSPSSMNMQPWEFILVTDRNRLQELSKVWRSGGHIASSAATVAVLAPQANDPREEAIHEFDLGQAAMSMMIAAADLGIGSCHSAVGDQDLARKVLGHPADRRCALLISLGYPADRPLKPIRSPKRRPIDQVIRRGHW